MRRNQIDKLASTLKSAGLCASVYDAKNMAESISTGVSANQEHMEKKMDKPIGKEIKEIFEPVESPEVEQEVETENTATPDEVYVNDDSFGSVESDRPIFEIMGAADDNELDSDSISIFGDEVSQVVEDETQAEASVETQEVQTTNVEPQQQVAQQTMQNQQPCKKPNLIRGDGLYELDREDKPRATLSEEEKKATDITKWFNFANR